MSNDHYDDADFYEAKRLEWIEMNEMERKRTIEVHADRIGLLEDYMLIRGASKREKNLAPAKFAIYAITLRRANIGQKQWSGRRLAEAFGVSVGVALKSQREALAWFDAHTAASSKGST